MSSKNANKLKIKRSLVISIKFSTYFCLQHLQPAVITGHNSQDGRTEIKRNNQCVCIMNAICVSNHDNFLIESVFITRRNLSTMSPFKKSLLS